MAANLDFFTTLSRNFLLYFCCQNMQESCSCQFPLLLLSKTDKHQKSVPIGARLFDDSECAICFGPLIAEIRNGDPVVGNVLDDEMDLAERLVEVLSNCGHTFHTRCLKEYYNNRPRPWLCPKDNRNLLPTDFRRLSNYNPASDALEEADRRARITTERNRQANERMNNEMINRELAELQQQNQTYLDEQQVLKEDGDRMQAELEKLKLETRFADDVEDDEGEYLSTMKTMEEQYTREQKEKQDREYYERQLRVKTIEEKEQEQIEKKRLDNLKKRAKKKEKQKQERNATQTDPERSKAKIMETAKKAIQLSGNNEGHPLLTDYESLMRIARFLAVNDLDKQVYKLNINLPELPETATRYVGYILKIGFETFSLDSLNSITLSVLNLEGDNGLIGHDYRITGDMRNQYTFFWAMFIFSTMRPGSKLSLNVYLLTDKTVADKLGTVKVERTTSNEMIVVTTMELGENRMKFDFNKIAGYLQLP